MKERFNNFTDRVTRIITFSLTAIAAVAISWFYVSEFGILSAWYSLPTMSIFTGLTTALIPWIGKKFSPAYAVTSAGISLFTILMVTHYMTFDFFGFLSRFVIIAIIGILTDLILSKDRVALVDIALDSILCFIATVAVVYLPSIYTIAVILVTYILILIIQVKPEYTKKSKNTTK